LDGLEKVAVSVWKDWVGAEIDKQVPTTRGFVGPHPSETRLRSAINEATPKPTSHSNTVFPQASSVFHGSALREVVQCPPNFGLQTLFFR
jgi:hypothetical protein